MSIEQTADVVENDDTPIENIDIEFLLVADWAETINGKLYIQGASWDRILLPPPDRPTISFAVVASILVPWHLTNRQHQFQLSLLTGDGVSVGPEISGGFTVGRPAKAMSGQKMRTPFAARFGAKITELGAYDVKLVVNNDIVKIVTFYIVKQL